MTQENKQKEKKKVKRDIEIIKQLSGIVTVGKKTFQEITEECNGNLYVRKHL